MGILRAARGVACAVLALAAPATARADEPVPADWRIERLDREFEVRAGDAIAIRNAWGDLRVRVGEADRARVHAVVQRHAADARAASLESRPEAGGVRLEVGWEAGAAPAAAGWERRRIDVAIEVPPGAPLRLRTERGLIEVKGHAGPLAADSGAGDLRLRVAGGPIEARTASGDILVVLAVASWAGTVRLEAPSGDVEVQFPARTDADVTLEGGGRFTTDYSLEVEALGPVRKRGRARLGVGGPEVSMRSERGDLRILRLPPPPAGAGGIAPPP